MTEPPASSEAPDHGDSDWGGVPFRVRLVRFLVVAILLALVVAVVPGIRVARDLSWVDVAIMALAFGAFEAVLRPVIDLLLVRYTVQTYGLVLTIVDIVSLGLLVWVFSGSVEVSGLLPILFGGVLIGVLRILSFALLGLTEPVIPEESGRGTHSEPTGLLKLSVNAREDVRRRRIQETVGNHAIDAAMSGDGTLASWRRRLQTWLWQPPVPLRSIPQPERFRLLLQDLGPTFVKIGQMISSQSRTLPSEWLEELEKLQSEVRPFPYEQVHETIVDELGAPPDQIFASFDREPIAAASLGQVHRASLPDGDVVAVKVQRPGIKAQLRSDVRILARLSQALERRYQWAVDFDLTDVVIEFGTTLLRELDYEVEAYNNRRLGRILEDIDGIRVPDVYYDLSSTAVLTMEFVSGVKSTDAEAIAAAGLDSERLADIVVAAAVKMLVIDGFFHADPHPGNVYVDLESGEMALLDTGMVGELSFQHRVKLGSLLLTIRDGDILGLAQTLKSLSVPFKETDDERYYRDFERRLTPFLDPPPGHNVQIAARVIPTAMDVLHENGYQFDARLSLALKSMAQAEAITQALVPSWTGTDFMQRAMVAVQEQALNAITVDAVVDVATKQASYLVREAVDQLPSVQDGIFKWLRHLKRGAVRVELDASDLGTQLQTLHGTVRMLTLGILIVGLVIGSAIATGTSQLADSPLEGVTDIAAVIFVGSAAVGSIWVIGSGIAMLRERSRRDRGPIDRF